jgi:hypothetical protein
MHRRSILWGVVLALGGALAGSRARAGSEAPSPSVRLKVVYHLRDPEKVNFVLGNVQNHFDGAAGLRLLPLPWRSMVRRRAPSIRPPPIRTGRGASEMSA